MADRNKVSITITAEDKAGPGFAKAAAQAEAFGRVVNATLRKEVAASADAARAEDVHARAMRLAADAAKTEAEADDVLAGKLHLVGGKLREVSAETDKAGGAIDRLGKKQADQNKNTGNATAAWIKWAGALAPVAPLVTGIAGAFAGAAAGIAAFGAIAGPVIKNAVSATSALVTANQGFDNSAQLVHKAITTNVTDLKAFRAAQVGLTGPQKQVEQLLSQQGTRWQDLTKAQQNAAISLSQNTKAQTGMLPAQKAALTALIAQGQAYNQLTPAQRAFGAGLSQLNTEWKKLQTAITPSLLKIAAATMKQLGGILSEVGKIAVAAAPGVGQLVHELLDLVGKVFTALAPAVKPGLAVLNQLVSILSGTLLGVLKILVSTFLQNQGVIKSFLSAFGVGLNALVGALGAVLHGLGPLVGQEMPLFVSIFRAAAGILPQVAKALVALLQAFSPLIPAAVKLTTAVAPALVILVKAAAQLVVAVSPLIGLVAKLAGLLTTVLAVALGVVIKALAQVIFWIVKFGTDWRGQWDLVKRVVADAHQWVNAKLQEMSNGIKSAWASIKSATDAAWHAVLDVIKSVWDSIRGAVQAGVSGVRSAVSWFGRLGGLFRGWWDEALHAVRSVADSMIAFVREVPRRILAALGNLGHLLWNAGKAIITGLWDGMKSAWNAVTGWLGGLGGIISSLKGPLSADAVLLYPHGQAIIGGLMAGMASMMPALIAQVGGVAGTISGGLWAPPPAGGLHPAGNPSWHVTEPRLWADVQKIDGPNPGGPAHRRHRSIPWNPGGPTPHGGPPPGPGHHRYHPPPAEPLQHPRHPLHHRTHHTSGGGGETDAINLTIEVLPGGTGLDQLFATWLRNQVRVLGGGNVQKAYGVPGH